MVASSFARWYLAKLKLMPMTTNLGTSLVIMASGDVLAQSLEHKNEHPSVENQPERHDIHHPKHQLSIRRATYRHAAGESSSDDNARSLNRRQPIAVGTSSDTNYQSPWQDIQEALRFWNPLRTATMAAWSVGAYTPFYISLYKLYDKFLPKQTPLSIASRVGLSFLCSIPVNAGFYIYGTTVNHTLDWISLNEKVKNELEQMGVGDPENAGIPMDWENLWAKCRLKLETELPVTVKTSGVMWIPINFFNFTVVPSHLRPLSLMFFSVFWNCYLSLSQHRSLDGHKEDGIHQ